MVELIEIKEQLNRLESGLLSQKSVLTFDEVCRFTGLSKSYLYKLTSLNKIPHFKPNGKMIYFERQAVEAWLMQNPIKTANEIEQQAANYVVLGKVKGGAK
jgi:excisionase family DNA binding protein